MENKINIVTYTLAAMAGICFISSIAILTGGGYE